MIYARIRIAPHTTSCIIKFVSFASYNHKRFHSETNQSRFSWIDGKKGPSERYNKSDHV